MLMHPSSTALSKQLTADDGNYYAVLFISFSWVVYYNKDILDANNIEYPTNDMTHGTVGCQDSRGK